MTEKGKIEFLDWAAVFLLIFIFAISYIKKLYYDIYTPYASIGTLSVLIIFFFKHINLTEAIKRKDWELGIVVIGTLIAIINILLSKSGWGVLVTIVDFMLILYLGNKVKLDKKFLYALAVISLIILATWINKGDKGFNTNLASRIVFSVASFGLTGMAMFFKKYDKEYLGKIITLACMLVLVLPIVWKLKARGVMIGIGVFIILNYFIPMFLWKNKAIGNLFVGLLIMSSIVIPLVYVKLWESGIDISFITMGKDFFSGRNIVWQQFLNAFYKEPWTGIGSDFITQIPDIAFTEVHNGLLHILVVFGVIIFSLVIILLYRRLTEVFKNCGTSIVAKQTVCFIISLLVISIFENYIVVSSDNLVLFLLLVVANQEKSDI